jgi:hypothetical protein
MSDSIIALKDVHFDQCKISKTRILSTKMQKTQSLTLKCSLRVTMAEWEAIFKSGKRNVVSNYRDIAIFSTVGNLFELLVYRYMYEEDLKGQLADCQHGFFKGMDMLYSIMNMVKNSLKSLFTLKIAWGIARSPRLRILGSNLFSD